MAECWPCCRRQVRSSVKRCGDVGSVVLPCGACRHRDRAKWGIRSAAAPWLGFSAPLLRAPEQRIPRCINGRSSSRVACTLPVPSCAPLCALGCSVGCARTSPARRAVCAGAGPRLRALPPRRLPGGGFKCLRLVSAALCLACGRLGKLLGSRRKGKLRVWLLLVSRCADRRALWVWL